MDYRGVLLLGSMIGALSLGTVSACSGPDPGAISFAERTSPGGAQPSGSSSGGSSGSTSGGSSGTAATDGGATEGGAGGDPVFGTSTFAAGAAAKQANEQAPGAAQHNGNVEGKSCMDGTCHGAGGAGPTWAFAGTVKTAKTGGQPVVGAEVRIGVGGVEFGKTYTDNAGNFWFEKVNGDPPANAMVGVRNATKMMKMSTPVAGAAGGACNSGGCHGTVPTQSAQGFVLLP